MKKKQNKKKRNFSIRIFQIENIRTLIDAVERPVVICPEKYESESNKKVRQEKKKRFFFEFFRRFFRVKFVYSLRDKVKTMPIGRKNSR